MKEEQLTQKQMIVCHLMDFGSITPLEALKEYGIFRLAARIGELNKSMSIKSKWCVHTNKFGCDVRFKKYYV